MQNSASPRSPLTALVITVLLTACVTLGYTTAFLYSDLRDEIRDNRASLQQGYGALYQALGELDVRLATCYGEAQHVRTRVVTLERILSHTQDKVFKLLMKAPAPQVIPMHPPFDSWEMLQHACPMYAP